MGIDPLFAAAEKRIKRKINPGRKTSGIERVPGAPTCCKFNTAHRPTRNPGGALHRSCFSRPCDTCEIGAGGAFEFQWPHTWFNIGTQNLVVINPSRGHASSRLRAREKTRGNCIAAPTHRPQPCPPAVRAFLPLFRWRSFVASLRGDDQWHRGCKRIRSFLPLGHFDD